ncbi:putative AMP-binding enzyme [Aspergillus bombycis]|uniref:Putative AMP-binding enzyme n=1 Tax=Aspergillus bombycis TaxID=109264 RepID=A0A1F8AAG2_9EURO|nr:putative AMP-binding enzyme [Aspergillus bombycis]OGM48318.1 putative AMP-binding enzyme [Aspergillus bombycis]
MIFEPPSRVPLPTTDVISYIFSDPPYDHDQPVYNDASDHSRSISYNQARVIVRKLIAGLHAWGVQKGDCVAIHSFNDIYYSMLVLAINGAGGIYTGTNPSYTPMELSHHIRASQAKFVISEPEIIAPIQAAMKETGIPESNLLVFDVHGQTVPAGLKSWQGLLSAGEEDWLRFDDLKTCEETAAARLFSSGTTGLPKATTLTHRNFIAQHELVFEIEKRPYQIRRLMALPMFHAAAAPSTHWSPLKGGQVLYVMRRFDLMGFVSNVEKFQITDLQMVPPIAVAIVMTPQVQARPYLKSVRIALCGAAPLSKDVQEKLRVMLAKDAPCTQDDTGSVGRLLPNVEAKLVDDEGKNVSAYGVRGEICVRGPTVTPGYFNNAAANACSFDEDGWYHTGDIAYCDKDTLKWYIVDRKKELIKVRGFQVAPPELEAVLLSHPLIIDAAVIGLSGVLPDSELPRAYVTRRPGTGDKLTEEEVQEYLGQRLAKYKALTGGVKFLDAIPKNASGKILKRVLREEAQKEVKAGFRPKL